MKAIATLVAGTLIILSLSLPGASAGAVGQNDTVTVISHVDIKPDVAVPNAIENTGRLFRAETEATQREKGLISYVVLQQTGTTNHFTIVETWQDAKDYEMHEGSDHTVKFREGIAPYLGSPFDSRIHHVFR